MKHKHIICLISILLTSILIYIYFDKCKETHTHTQTYVDKCKEAYKTIKNLNLDNPNNRKIPYPIYYINMDKENNRRSLMEKNLSLISNNYTRINAINGKNIKNKYNDTIDGLKFINEFDDIDHANLGCILSHIKSIQTAYNKGDNFAIICEDDILIDLYRFSNPIDDIIKNAPKDWQILKLFTGIIPPENLSTNKNITFFMEDYGWSAVCYLINRSGMESILSKIKQQDEYRITKNLGTEGSFDLWFFKLCKTYAILPVIFIPNVFIDSTLHNDHIELYHSPVLLKHLEFILKRNHK